MINVNSKDHELEEITKYIKDLKTTRLETLGRTNKLSNAFDTLEKFKKFKEIKEVLELIAGYNINVLEYEMKEGLRILLKAKFLEDVLEIFYQLLTKKKILDEHIVISIITVCFTSNEESIITKSFNSIITYYTLHKNISHSFWQTSIDGLLKIKHYDLANILIKLYPIKYSYSESLWKKIIISNIIDNFSEIFILFQDKYESRAHNDDIRGFENIFNIFLEEVSNYFEKIDQEKIEFFFDVLIKNKISIREANLEKFLIKVVNSHIDNFNKLEEYLIKCDCMLTKKIIEKILEEYSKLNKNLSVYSVLKLCKTKKIPVPYESLSIPSKCLKELLKFIIDKSELHFEDSFITILSQDNQSYIMKNFNQSVIGSVSEKNSSIVTSEMNENEENVENFDKTLKENESKIHSVTNNAENRNTQSNIEIKTSLNPDSHSNTYINIGEEKIEDDFVIY